MVPSLVFDPPIVIPVIVSVWLWQCSVGTILVVAANQAPSTKEFNMGGVADIEMKKRSSSAQHESSFLRGKGGAMIIGLLGLLLIAAGIIMQLRNDVRLGIDARTMQPKVISGPFVGFLGVLSMVFAWFMWRDTKKA